MEQTKQINVEVTYARPDEQRIIAVQVAAGSSIEHAILHSGVLQLFPEIDLAVQKVGVFGKLRALTDILQEGDRVEIYRPLIIDPKDARRAKAKKKR